MCLTRAACHFSGYLRSVLNSWWNAYSYSSPHGCSLPNQRSYRPFPSARGGSHQPPRFSLCSVSAKTCGCWKVCWLILLGQNQTIFMSRFSVFRCCKQHFSFSHHPFLWFLQSHTGPHWLHGGLPDVASSWKFQQVWHENIIQTERYSLSTQALPTPSSRSIFCSL